MFLVNNKLVWRDKKSYTSPLTNVHHVHVHFMIFAVFKNLKLSFSEDNMPGHALDICLENATKIVKVIPLNVKNEDQTLR